jgi:HlyD family secretion protein
MREALVPSAVVEDCIDVHLAHHAPTGHALYWSILALTIASAAAMPVVQVPLTIQATGVIRPGVERRDARSAESGIVRDVYVADGDRVRAGDTLLTLDARVVTTRLAATDSILTARQKELGDLMILLRADASRAPWGQLESAHRRQQAREHGTMLAELHARAEAARRDADRVRALVARGFATAEQVDNHAAAQRTAEAAVREQIERMRSAWSDARAAIADELQRLTAERVELAETLARHAITAPVEGTVEMLAFLSRGSVVRGGERVASISPNADLVGEVVLTPRDIALVRRGTPARLMIDALNYREWGVIDATVTEVADDAATTGEQPTFRVRCALARTDLRLRGGQRAALGKGMTFRARFVIAERSVLQLLFARIDEWLNPAPAPQGAAIRR